jgi:hypothetical protein
VIPTDLAAAAEQAVATVGARRLARLEQRPVHVDHARATAVKALPGGDAAAPASVVTVAALVRRAEDDRWGAPTPLRFAVVVQADGRLRAPPWPLPGRDQVATVAAPGALEAVELSQAPQLVEAAADALARAGYGRPQIQALHRVGDDRALRVEALARPPGASRRGSTVAWLDSDAQTVLGHPPIEASPSQRRDPEPAPSAAPSPAPSAAPSPAPSAAPSPARPGDPDARHTPSRPEESP